MLGLTNSTNNSMRYHNTRSSQCEFSLFFLMLH
uniref:Uncharacterized protein MANES_10G100400 n=1 Tax=Rhizophora mucronata TaxID=61149 RepID=A0A2P2IUI3_RHIMU